MAANLGLLLAWLNYRPKPVETISKRDYLPTALAAFDRGAYGEAKRLAAMAREQGTQGLTESGGPSFVQGAATAMEADAMWEEDQRRYYLLAARHLEDAAPAGLSQGPRGVGTAVVRQEPLHQPRIYGQPADLGASARR